MFDFYNSIRDIKIQKKNSLEAALKKFVKGLEDCPASDKACETNWKNYEPPIGERDWKHMMNFFLDIELKAYITQYDVLMKSRKGNIVPFGTLPLEGWIPFPSSGKWSIQLLISKEVLAEKIEQHFLDSEIVWSTYTKVATGPGV